MQTVFPTVVVVSLLVAARAHAQPTGAQAEALFREGKTLMAANRIAEACDAFAASQKLEPMLVTLLTTADCRERNHQLATAWGLFLAAMREARTSSASSATALYATASTRAAALEPRLSKLTIDVPESSRVAGLTIIRGTEAVEPGSWNLALPVDGGTYVVSATAPGYREWSTPLTIAIETDVQRIVVPAFERAPAPPAALAVDDESTDDDAPVLRSYTVPIALFAVGGVALGGALGFELWGESLYDHAQEQHDEALYERANTRRYLAQVVAVGGLASVGVGVWLYLRERSDARREPTARVVPRAAPDQLAVSIEGRF